MKTVRPRSDSNSDLGKSLSRLLPWVSDGSVSKAEAARQLGMSLDEKSGLVRARAASELEREC